MMADGRNTKGAVCTDSNGLCITSSGDLTEADAGSLHAIHTLSRQLFDTDQPVAVCIDSTTSQSIYVRKVNENVVAVKKG
ncbi:hypothetical protein PTSG_02593 [Salpingoeca rosetta]|uniref:Uncharacterized protein n=1 Tax=Salpingoeca rosetta (strain ATCC 50818 / BSB-021) TaxID=946362 RepID=F2U2R4_SALR5|nr:uncharacterized protein PTSG_02593 [Salpingoeca rosetta]EGD81908.1 hypothetical protein PTSG_02593 [Salpingoeca rosetta]|eukprot:XP_004996091.1 hypothetical protein PTSG_02593 [Salpingoeca rosetta]